MMRERTSITDGDSSLQATLHKAQGQILHSLETLEGISRDLGNMLAASLQGDGAGAAIPDSPEGFARYVGYRHLLRRIRELADRSLPKDATVLVISKGDDALLNLRGRRAWHFPQTDNGTYAGHYPADGRAAVAHLEALRRGGADFLLLPATALWWLDHYPELRQHLEARGERVVSHECCSIYRLGGPRRGTGLKGLQQTWDELGRRDPLWAILTVPEKINRRWSRREFFDAGEREVSDVMAYVEALGFPLARRRALDFGCGVGRLTQALCKYFGECHGVDIAPSMVELAVKYNRHRTKCQYHLNDADNLRIFRGGFFDFVYSNIVLQHMKPELVKGYLREFLRVLAPGGLLIFQLPSEPNPALTTGARGDGALHSALPDEAFRAAIKVKQSSLTARAAAQRSLRVKIQNISGVTWTAAGTRSGKYRLYLGNSWLNERGELLAFDDGRAVLPSELRPGEEIELPLLIKMPSKPGAYMLELDLVQEGITWFRHKGSETCRVKVKVKENPDLGNGGERPAFLTPRMEMHGIPREAVLKLLAQSGGITLDVVDDFSAAPEWNGYRYCVTKKAIR